jgi:3-deoxy-D-manno-octulosonic-acid transferase
MKILYELLIRSYYFGIILASMFNPKAKQWLSSRKRQLIPEFYNKKIVWMHASSVGEFEQGKPFIKAIQAKDTSIVFVITFFSPSAQSLIDKKEYSEFMYYLPLDTIKNAHQFISKINPIAVIWIKYDFWINYLNVLKSRDIPIFLVAAYFPTTHFIYSKLGRTYSTLLNNFSKIYLQNSDNLNLSNIKTKVIQSADTRYLTVSDISKQDYDNHIIKSFIQNDRVVVLGSVYQQEIEHVINKVNDLEKGTKYLIIPHVIDTSFIQNLISTSNSKVTLYSNPISLEVAKILIVDTYGMLSKLYRYADLVYIGGGFNKGIHNILEPLAYNKEVIIGPNHKRFNEVNEFADIQAINKIYKISELHPLITKKSSNQRFNRSLQIKELLSKNINSALIQVNDVTNQITYSQ